MVSHGTRVTASAFRAAKPWDTCPGGNLSGDRQWLALAVSPRLKNRAVRAPGVAMPKAGCQAGGVAVLAGSPGGQGAGGQGASWQGRQAGKVARLAGCQAGRVPGWREFFTHAQFCTCGVSPTKVPFCLFRCHCPLSLCSVVLEAPVLPGTCCVYYQSLSPRFSTARRFSSSGFSPEPPLKSIDSQKTQDLISSCHLVQHGNLCNFVL